VQREWWFHRSGCRAWFIAERDTRTNEVKFTALPGAEDPGGEAGLSATQSGGDLL
jgi:sarcosine oxidase delta subunit